MKSVFGNSLSVSLCGSKQRWIGCHGRVDPWRTCPWPLSTSPAPVRRFTSPAPSLTGPLPHTRSWYPSPTASPSSPGTTQSGKLLCSSARIFKLLWSPGIDSKEWIPPAYVAWRAGTITYFYSVPSHHRLFKNSSTGRKPHQFRTFPKVAYRYLVCECKGF